FCRRQHPILGLHLAARNGADVAVRQLRRTGQRVFARILRNELRMEIARQLLRELALAGRLRSRQADPERTSDFLHSNHPITARMRKEAYNAALAKSLQPSSIQFVTPSIRIQRSVVAASE